MSKWSLPSAFLVTVLALDVSMARADDFASKAAASFNPVVKEYDIPGLVVGVTRNGVHEYYTVGLASRADSRPVTPDTIFELGSISKVFNVTLAALAEGRGKLNLNETVAQHVCVNKCSIGDNLTLMDLATHRSGGLPLQVPDHISGVSSLIGWLTDWRPPQPGARSYSNISIGVLGYISGLAMGSNYKQAAQDVLFPAFGLRHTWIDVPKDDMSQYALGYDRQTNAPIRVSPGILYTEAYGVKSSARDMLKVLDIELGGGQASEELRKAIRRTQEGQFETAFFTQNMIWEQYPWPVDLQTMVVGNGYDFVMKLQPAHRLTRPKSSSKNVILNKTGSTHGFGGYIALIPCSGLGVVVLANKNYPNEARIKATYSLIKALGPECGP